MSRYKESVIRDNIAMYYGEALRAIAQNTASINGGSVMNTSLADLLYPNTDKKTETKTAEEIAEDICKKAGIKVIKKNESV